MNETLIVAANSMDTLVQSTYDGTLSKSETITILKGQQRHKSSAVVRRANKLLNELSSNN